MKALHPEEHPAPRGGQPVAGRARVLLVVALSVVVCMAFAVSWTALRDVATAIGIPPFAAVLYPFVVDGLMALALVATLVLTGDARKTALQVLAAYTAASLTLNYVHGLVPELHHVAADDRVRLAGVDWAHWALVGLAAGLPVGAIYYGSDLVARVLHHRPESTSTEAERSGAEQQESTLPTPVPVDPSEPVQSTPNPAPVAPTDREQSPPTGDPTPEAESTPTAPTGRPRPKTAPAPRRSTGPVPPAAKQSTPRRSLEELLEAARALPDDDQQSAEQLRKALRVGAPRAREIRDRLADERDQAPAPRALHAVYADGTDDAQELTAAGGGGR